MTEKKQKNDTLPGHTANNIVYLVLVEDLSIREKKRSFLTLKVDESASNIQFVGCEIKWSDRDKVKDYEDAIKLANLDEVYHIKYPWHRVISVRNLSYKRKDLNNAGEK